MKFFISLFTKYVYRPSVRFYQNIFFLKHTPGLLFKTSLHMQLFTQKESLESKLYKFSSGLSLGKKLFFFSCSMIVIIFVSFILTFYL